MYGLKQYTKIALSVVLVSGALVGCNDRVALAEAEMRKIQDGNSQPLEPPPQPKVIEDYAYESKDMRSPFVPKSLIKQQEQDAKAPVVSPDFGREREELENYDLAELVYVGRFEDKGVSYGMIQTPDGIIHNVSNGRYMGKNHGKIADIMPDKIKLIEIVEHPRLKYIEHDAEILRND